MDKKKYAAAGLSLIITGLSFLIGNFFEGFDCRLLWPVFITFPIVFLTFGYFGSPDVKKNSLFTIFLLIQLMIFFTIWTTVFRYEYMIKIWPFFIIMPGISFLPMYFIKRDIRLLFLSFALVVTGTVFSLFTLGLFPITILNKIWPVFLIFGGVFIIAFYFKTKK